MADDTLDTLGPTPYTKSCRTPKKIPIQAAGRPAHHPQNAKAMTDGAMFFHARSSIYLRTHRVRVYACGMLKKCVCQRKPTRSSMPTQGLDEFHIRKGSTIDKKMRSSPWTTTWHDHEPRISEIWHPYLK